MPLHRTWHGGGHQRFVARVAVEIIVEDRPSAEARCAGELGQAIGAVDQLEGATAARQQLRNDGFILERVERARGVGDEAAHLDEGRGAKPDMSSMWGGCAAPMAKTT